MYPSVIPGFPRIQQSNTVFHTSTLTVKARRRESYNPIMASADNLQYRWDEPNFSTATSWFEFSHCARTPLPWIEELDKAAVCLAESTTKPIWICSSGGVDSETLCEIFLRLNLSSQRSRRGRGAFCSILTWGPLYFHRV